MLIPLLISTPEAQAVDILDLPVLIAGDGYSLAPDEGLIRTEMDSGYQRLRRKHTVVTDAVKVKWWLNGVQMWRFRLWYSTQLNHGVKWFELRIPSGFEPDGCTIPVKQCRFIAPWQAVKKGAYWEVSADIKLISSDGVRVNAEGVLEPLPAVNTWDDLRQWVE